ncbi:MAG: hypothetical protein O3B38_02960 [Chloroflexi bacterium]|nr:hypothetical protein [Chloroflexota bacterium]
MSEYNAIQALSGSSALNRYRGVALAAPQAPADRPQQRIDTSRVDRPDASPIFARLDRFETYTPYPYHTPNTKRPASANYAPRVEHTLEATIERNAERTVERTAEVLPGIKLEQSMAGNSGVARQLLAQETVTPGSFFDYLI